MKTKYYTVTEYAALTGKSRQSIYKRLKTTLQPFVKRDGEAVLISEKALKNEQIQANTPPSLSTLETTPETTGDNPTETPSKLHRIIATQAEQIKDLNEQLKTLQAAILSQNEQITELLSKSLQLQDQLHKIIVIPQLQAAQETTEMSTPLSTVDNPIVNPGDNPKKEKPQNNPLKAILGLFKKSDN